MRQSGTLKLAVILAVAALVIQWVGTGGPNSSLPLDDPRVSAAWQYAVSDRSVKRITDHGIIQKAWLSTRDTAYEVHLGVKESPEYSYHFIIAFDAGDRPVSMEVDYWRGTMVPRYLGLLSIGIFAIWLLSTFIVPQLAVKCPDCPPSLLFPPVTLVNDSAVYPGGHDANGDSLAPIIRRDYICPRCNYVKVTYFVPGHYRPTHVWKGAWFERPGAATAATDLDWYQKALDNWHVDNAAKTRFKTYEEWKAFWDELKASEHEERGPAVHS